MLDDGRVLDVANVIWCTGFRPDFSWIDLPAVRRARRAAALPGSREDQPGLYFIGLDFLYAASSGQINGVGRDAAHVVEHLAGRPSWTESRTADPMNAQART